MTGSIIQMAYLSYIVVCATTKDVVFRRRIHIREWEETFGGLFDRTVAMSRLTVVKPSDLGAHPTLHVCQQFGCYFLFFIFYFFIFFGVTLNKQFT